MSSQSTQISFPQYNQIIETKLTNKRFNTMKDIKFNFCINQANNLGVSLIKPIDQSSYLQFFESISKNKSKLFPDKVRPS
jgi:hypothetical protein